MIGGTIIAIFRGTHVVTDDGKKHAIPHLGVTLKAQDQTCEHIMLHPTNYPIEIGAGVWGCGDMAHVTFGRREIHVPRLRVRWDGQVVTPGT